MGQGVWENGAMLSLPLTPLPLRRQKLGLPFGFFQQIKARKCPFGLMMLHLFVWVFPVQVNPSESSYSARLRTPGAQRVGRHPRAAGVRHPRAHRLSCQEGGESQQPRRPVRKSTHAFPLCPNLCRPSLGPFPLGGQSRQGFAAEKILATSPIQRKTKDRTRRGVVPPPIGYVAHILVPPCSRVPKNPDIHSLIQSCLHHGVLRAYYRSAVF